MAVHFRAVAFTCTPICQVTTVYGSFSWPASVIQWLILCTPRYKRDIYSWSKSSLGPQGQGRAWSTWHTRRGQVQPGEKKAQGENVVRGHVWYSWPNGPKEYSILYIIMPSNKICDKDRRSGIWASNVAVAQRLNEHRPACGGCCMISFALLLFFPRPSSIKPSLSQPIIFLTFVLPIFSPCPREWGRKQLCGCLAADFGQFSTVLHPESDFILCLPRLRHLQHHLSPISDHTILHSTLQ